MQPNTIADPGAVPGGPAETFGRLVRAILDRFLLAEPSDPGPLPHARPSREPAVGPGRGTRPAETARASRGRRARRNSRGGRPRPGRRARWGSAPATRDALATPMRQLVKACFNPEFKVCRDSYKEVSPDGTCRRQELDRTRKRASGAHCVDCPYWVGLTPGQHMLFLAKAWRPAGLTCFISHVDVFLPEDFRALRQLLHAQARIGR